MLAAAPTTPPCFRHWRRLSLLHSGHIQRKIIFYFAFVAACGPLQTHFHGWGRKGKQLLHTLASSPSQSLRASSPEGGSPWHNGTVFGFARASPFGRGGTAQAVTERARMLAANEPSQSVIFFSIPRFLPVENSLRLCYDRKQRIFPKIDSEEGNGSCVKVVF